MLKKPAVALFAAILGVSAACGSSATPAPTAPPAATTAPAATMAPTAPPAATTTATTGPAASASAACTVGVSWNNFQQPRWAAHDKPNIQQTVEAGGGKYIDADANLSNEQQLTDVDTLISKGANVLILLAQDHERHPAGGRQGEGRRHPGHRV